MLIIIYLILNQGEKYYDFKVLIYDQSTVDCQWTEPIEKQVKYSEYEMICSAGNGD